jgi:hypothetical protein
MNELEFKKHLKDLVHGHHHPEEHDWDRQAGAPKKAPAKRRTSKKAARKK